MNVNVDDRTIGDTGDGTQIAYRPGRPDDAGVLVDLVNYAGEGLPEYLWAQMAEPGETARDVGLRRARRDEGGFSYRNAEMAILEDQAAGCHIGYAIAPEPEPVPDDLPAMFRPLQELENLAAGSWYINVLAVQPRFRGLGIGTGLISRAGVTASALGHDMLSLIVADGNHGARRLYGRCGFVERARRHMVKDGWITGSENWILMTKAL